MVSPERFEIKPDDGGVMSLGALYGNPQGGPIGTTVAAVDPVRNAPEMTIAKTPAMDMGGLG